MEGGKTQLSINLLFHRRGSVPASQINRIFWGIIDKGSDIACGPNGAQRVTDRVSYGVTPIGSMTIMHPA